MPLTSEQRAELEKYGPETVRIKLMQCGPGRTAAVPGFNHGTPRGDVEDWLGEKHAQEVASQRRTLKWAIIAAVAGIVSVIVAATSIAVTIWLAD